MCFNKVEFVRRIKHAQARAKEQNSADVPKVPKEYEFLAKVDENQVKNIYNLGFVRNLWSVLYPPSSRRIKEEPQRKKK